MNDPAATRAGSPRAGTSYVGPLGSTIHVLHADADTVAELAAIDWNRHFRRVCLDPVRGLITLMSPSFPHEDLATILDDVVDAAGSLIAGATKGLRSTRLRGQDEPPGTGMEPDCAFYVGERAKAYYAARNEGKEAVNAYVERVAPDLVVERSPTPTRERPNATRRWVCGSFGTCTGPGIPGSSGRSCARCFRGVRHACWRRRRYWRD